MRKRGKFVKTAFSLGGGQNKLIHGSIAVCVRVPGEREFFFFCLSGYSHPFSNRRRRMQHCMLPRNDDYRETIAQNIVCIYCEFMKLFRT